MLKTVKNFFKKEDGLGTVEIVILVAILIGIALIFRTAIFEKIQTLTNDIFEKSGVEADNLINPSPTINTQSPNPDPSAGG